MTGAVWGVVLAAGGGVRFGGAKQFVRLRGLRLVDRAVATLAEVCDGVVVVLPPASGDLWAGARVAVGGATRSASVRAGLAAVPASAEIIVLHAASHPLATPALASAVVDAVCTGAAGAVPALPLTDALKRVDGGRVVASLGRVGFATAQMPQAFRADVLRAVHLGEPEALEDSALVEQAGAVVATVPGEPANVHVTTPTELALAERLARRR